MKPGLGTKNISLNDYFQNFKWINQAVVSMKQRWYVQNHIKTVHAIAVCNLVEMTMGIIAEASIPKDLRWLPMGMNIDYVKKATGKLTATSKIDPGKFFLLDKYPGEVKVPVEVKNSDGVLVTKADVSMLSLYLLSLFIIIMYVWMYVSIYVCMYVCKYVCMYVYMYVCMYEWMYVSIYVCMYVCMYVCK